MTLHEPATFATDCVLAAWSAWLGARLDASLSAVRWWRRTFFWTAAAGLAGGVYHGFGPALPAPVADWLWRVTLIAINVTSLCLTLAAAHATLSPPSLAFWQRAAWAKTVVCMAYAMAQPVFLSVIVDYGSAMLFVVAVESYAWRTKAAGHVRWILAGVIASALGAAAQQLGWAPHRHFNHNDLYHVIQILALGLFFCGARSLS